MATAAEHFLTEHGDDHLEHYGVKGMKWGVTTVRDPIKFGVRKTATGKIRPRATIGFRDHMAERWRLSAETKAYGKVYRKAAPKIRAGTKRLNEDPKYKGQDFTQDSPLRREYYGAYSKMATEQLNAAVHRRQVLMPWREAGMSPNKRLELHFEFDASKEIKPRVTIRRADTRSGRKDDRASASDTRASVKKKNVQHAEDLDGPGEELEVYLITDEKGYIQDLDAPSDAALNHDGISSSEEFLEHYGVLGMRWGVKRSRSAKASERIATSEDKARANELATRVRAGGGTRVLSNNELKSLNERLNLEQNYAKLNPVQKSKGRKILDEVLRNERNAVIRGQKGPLVQLLEKGLSTKKKTK